MIVYYILHLIFIITLLFIVFATMVIFDKFCCKSFNKKILFIFLLSIVSWCLFNGYFHMISYWKSSAIEPYNSFSEMPDDVYYIATHGPTGAALAFSLLFGELYLPLLTLILYPFYWLFNRIKHHIKK